ncbi:hypothetical protein CLOSTHATH_06114 [Hungatella hathewayi DSM 13479]|uniref:Uncharacterized protein n=1 Tax=Hungatella hathewayi DSM 13479 TaxID=566550 RepID=D3AR58_9FIRM|nr:hypothetical protein CLOSTHATH_06114 [Hungatella hathewayi DSM 13479]
MPDINSKKYVKQQYEHRRRKQTLYQSLFSLLCGFVFNRVLK